ncbi:hypothetical protein GQX74_014952 [Glossina fuscipes]|nr:hypothetical protein GQX74_014952 [Glossina fuscipes]
MKRPQPDLSSPSPPLCSLAIIGEQTRWHSFKWSSNSSFSANVLLSNHFISAEHFSLTVALSVSFSLPCATSSIACKDRIRSASANMRSISSLDRRPLSLVIVIFSDLPVLLSLAET